jgi:cysteine-rich repeat protein
MHQHQSHTDVTTRRPSGRPRNKRHAYLPALCAAVTVFALAQPVRAVDLVTGLGGPRDYGETVFGPNDDSSVGPIDITPIFGPGGLNFFGTNYTSLFVNNNGNITFTAPLGTYTPFGISGGSTPIIAAFFADVDTRGAHTPPDSNVVYYDVDPVGGVFTATWDLVGYYGNHSDKLNNFQIRLINQGSGDFDIEFRYQQLQWTTGDASGGSGGLGGSVARAGYSAGNQTNYFELAASGDQAAMLDLVNQSNIDEPGRFVFAVTSGHPQICGDGLLEGFESCDDHNTMDGDGCSSNCAVEPCHTCTGEPSVCSPEPDGTSCSDNQFCNGAEICQSGSCTSGTAPCPGDCDESLDSCPNSTPTSTATETETPTETPTPSITETPSETPTATETATNTWTPVPADTYTATLSPTPTATPTPILLACAPAPASSCKQLIKPAHSKLRIWNYNDDKRDRIDWQWRFGEGIAAAEFGDPTTDTRYALCIYDGNNQLIFAASVPAGDGWRNVGKLMKYTDNPGQTYCGVRHVRLSSRSAAPMKASIRFIGLGQNSNLGNQTASGNFPDLGDFPLVTEPNPIRAQMVNDEGGCWEARYQAHVARNGGQGHSQRFKASND